MVVVAVVVVVVAKDVFCFGVPLNGVFFVLWD